MLIDDIARAGALKFGDKPAVITTAGTISFTEQYRQVSQLAAGLRASGIRDGDRVAILSTNRAEYAIAYYGVPMAAGVLTFVNYRWNADEIVAVLTHAEVSGLIVEPRLLGRISHRLGEIGTLRLLVALDENGQEPRVDDECAVADVLGWAGLLARGGDARLNRDQADDLEPAWLIYTSGTTGRPKGVVLTHRNVCTALSSWLIEVSPAHDEVQILPFPMCHVAGVGVPGYAMRGVTVVLQAAFEPVEFMSAIERYRVTGIPVAPTMLSMLADHPRSAEFDLSSVILIQYGSAPMTAPLLERSLRLFPQAEFTTGFGMTELAANVLWFDARSHSAAAAGDPNRLRAVGRPMTLARTRVVDDDMRDVPVGTVGELVVQGDQVSRQYWRDPEASAAAWAGGWFHTGDLARVDEGGFYHIVDRKKDIVITGGENVYSREVEDALVRHPGVLEAAVVGIPDERWGERVTAFVVRRGSAEVDADELRAFVAASLAGYKVPRAILFLDELPRTTSGKVVKQRLRERGEQADRPATEVSGNG